VLLDDSPSENNPKSDLEESSLPELSEISPVRSRTRVLARPRVPIKMCSIRSDLCVYRPWGPEPVWLKRRGLKSRACLEEAVDSEPEWRKIGEERYMLSAAVSAQKERLERAPERYIRLT
jgi:hypothetical protein